MAYDTPFSPYRIPLGFEKTGDGYYTIVSMMPHTAKNIRGTLLYDKSARMSTAATGGSLLDEANSDGSVASPNVNAKANNPLVNNNTPQEAQERKDNTEETVTVIRCSFSPYRKTAVVMEYSTLP